MENQTSCAPIRPENYKYLQDHVYSQSGIVLEGDKHYLFESRLAPIVRQLGLTSINDLCALLLKTRPAELSRQIVEAMTTNETYFFRDPAHYDAIREVLIPRLKEERRGANKLSFWSAASSTGQEAYSLAIALVEEGLKDWNIQILGTDFSSSVVERARSGIYRQVEVNRGLPASVLTKHFTRKGTDWQLNEEVRRMVTFQTIDLRKSMRAFGPFDVVLCRNVMIYFDAETKKNILKELHGTLSRGGWLMVGGAETAFGVEEWFDKQIIGAATVYVAK